MLSSEEFESLIAKVKERISVADRTGELSELLEKLNIELPTKQTVVEKTDEYISNPLGKILVIGESSVKIGNLLKLMKDEFCMDNRTTGKRFDFVLNYKDINHYDFNRINKNDYAAVLAGPMPHCAVGKGEYSSVLVKMESNDTGSYPPVYRLNSNGQLKITKDNFRERVRKLIDQSLFIV